MLRCTGNVKRVSDKMFTASKSMMASIENDRQIHPDEMNITKYIDSYVLEGVARVVLNLDDEGFKLCREEIKNYLFFSNWSASAENEAAGLARLFPTLTPILKLADKEHKKSCEELVAILRKYISSTMNGQNNNTIASDDHASLLSYLLSANVLDRDIDGSLERRDLTLDEIISHVLSLLSEMYSTTTAAIQFILYELAINPDVQENLYKEMCHYCGTGDNFTLTECDRMEYFDMILYEAIRLHPIAPGLSRVCTRDCKIRNVTFKEGMVVRVMTSPLYRDENIYKNPDEFDPERFSKKNRETRHQYSFLPFGQGPRMCPGQKLAIIEVKYAVISIIKSYVLSTSKNTEIPLKEALRPSLTPANGVTISLTPRT
ncbi:Cytochrome P450 3A4 [Mactra antiquata]